ncbi:aldo/keto reductase [Auraticoccus sp. F435]|uniref:Aldo/keto reductase n=1 Tax=Auraticoccus cholistanensis TaxID=2656650 RepID=A0A6A9V2C1_9ACTN|nr:aldo/keto reductase [Auraticoccus cholistanensis]MVA77714.1 aldo/keto reductase [Auraticoccus cholistanensis]
MQTRTLGPFTVSAIGLGAMQLSMSSKPLPDEAQATRTIHAALDAGINFIDTADIYAPSWDAMGHNELVVARALKSWGGDRDSVVVGTKAGITRGEGETWGRDGSAEYLRAAVEKALTRLEVDVIDLFQWHRPDRWKVYGEVVQVFADLKAEGKIKAVGISNANVEEIEVALEVLGEGGLASVQNEFSPRFRSSADELRLCGEHGVAFLPWSPLGGASEAAEPGGRHTAFAEIAAERGVSPQQVVLAWELAQGEHVIPIPGASRPESIVDSARAADLQLTEEELARLD